MTPLKQKEKHAIKEMRVILNPYRAIKNWEQKFSNFIANPMRLDISCESSAGILFKLE